MSKKIAMLFISFYQNVISYAIKSIVGVSDTCRFEVSCSEFAKKTIQKEGVFIGGFKSIKRVLSCQPFYHEYI